MAVIQFCSILTIASSLSPHLNLLTLLPVIAETLLRTIVLVSKLLTVRVFTLHDTLLALFTHRPKLSAEAERATATLRLRDELRWVGDVGVGVLSVLAG
jgi:hypothetical protein